MAQYALSEVLGKEVLQANVGGICSQHHVGLSARVHRKHLDQPTFGENVAREHVWSETDGKTVACAIL